MEIKIRKRRMADNIPFEMQVEIMKRLPVKSLAVLRSVSKAWKSIIDSPHFITDYTNFHQHHRLLIRYEVVKKIYRKHNRRGSIDNVVKFIPYYETEFKYVSIFDNEECDTVCNAPLSFQLLNYQVFVGMSQGLLCLFGNSLYRGCEKETAVIWNPSLGKSIAIDLPFEDELGTTVLGFGVRPDNLDPMIVMVGNVLKPYPLLVFTLSSRVWRVPRGNRPPMSIGFADLSPVATHDRCIYWKAHDRSINLVVAFDMVSEDFTEINLPYSVAHRHKENLSISKIKDSLALLDYYNDGYHKPFCDVWMMLEDGAQKSFTKLFTIKTPSLSTEVLGFRKNDQPILETKIGKEWVGSLELYEPRTGTIKKMGIDVEEGSCFLSSYTETLLLLDHLDELFVPIQLQ